MKRSIRVRLLLSHLFVIILAMGLSGVLLLSFLERYFVEATEESLIAQAQITAQTLIPGAITTGPAVEVAQSRSNVLNQRQTENLALQTEDLQLPSTVSPGELDLSYLADSAPQLGTQLETRIRVLDTDGMILVDSASTAESPDLSHDSLVKTALTGEYASRITDESVIVAMPTLVEDELVGVVYLSQSLDDVRAVLGDLRIRWVISTAIALFLSGLIGLVLSGAITRPLRRLTRAAGAVASGHFDTQVPVRSRDELGRLSDTFNDMTARLRAARQMQIDFVANVSHELRTPLTSIKGTVETLRDGAVDDIAVRDRFLKTVENETNRLIRLVNDLLILSRADSEALNLHREAVNVPELIREVVARLTPRADVRDVALTTQLPTPLPSAWIDRDRTAQVLVNVLDNAIKYSHPGAEVSVSASMKGDMVEVRVEDTGIGIPAEDLPRIGERFYRADKARVRTRTGARTGGSGLGLAISKTLVEAQGGRLHLSSVVGEGTTVLFTLPRSS
jgi:signal transduction histidine kinase